MIKLNEYESLFIFLSKNHFSDSKHFMDKDQMKEMALDIWSKRCGVDRKYLHLGKIIPYLTTLAMKLYMFKNEYTILQFIENCNPIDKYSVKGSVENFTRDDYTNKVFDAYMSYFSFLKVLDDEKNVLIELEKKNLYNAFKKFGKKRCKELNNVRKNNEANY